MTEIALVILKAMLEDPEMRAVLEGLALKIFAEVFFALESDSKFKASFMALAAKLRDPTLTVEEKQDVLKKLQGLHSTLNSAG